MAIRIRKDFGNKFIQISTWQFVSKGKQETRQVWMLNTCYWSICHVENHGFFCVLCKKHMTNAQNKSQTFIESPSKRLKEDSLKTHMASTVYSSAIQADLSQRMSVFHQNFVEKKTNPFKEGQESQELWFADGWSYTHNTVLLADLIYPVLGPRKFIRYNNVPVYSECARRLCKLQLRSYWSTLRHGRDI